MFVFFLYFCFREFAYFWINCRFEQFYLNFYLPKIIRYRKLFIQEVIQILLYDLPELILTLKMNAHDLFAINFLNLNCETKYCFQLAFILIILLCGRWTMSSETFLLKNPKVCTTIKFFIAFTRRQFQC